MNIFKFKIKLIKSKYYYYVLTEHACKFGHNTNLIFRCSKNLRFSPFQLPYMSTVQRALFNFQLEQILQLRDAFLLHKSTLLTKYLSSKSLMAFENTRLAANKGNPYKVPSATLSHIISSIVFDFVLFFVNRLSS